ncbi:DUF732 domain-containing protein [Mycobacterium tilburgii]|uniref:DUF732 domain-containing protein n=1 Tax=Mycobacterium tilburgii TaxID=44467 RepID=UPI0011831951|nr:DUF732 domain-containing protein [Mycobacterium tilburgii]
MAPTTPRFWPPCAAPGVGYTDPAKTVATGNAVCELIGDGRLGAELVDDLTRNNPRLTTAQAIRFVGISVKYFCRANSAIIWPARGTGVPLPACHLPFTSVWLAGHYSLERAVGVRSAMWRRR